MALIIENGTIVSGANSYVDVNTIKDYAALRGITFVDDASVEIFAIQSMDYLETLSYKGAQVDPDTQELQWPRKGAIVNGRELPETTIPKQLKNAQCQLCIYRFQGIPLFQEGVGGSFVKREKVGPLETEYSEAVYLAQGGAPVIPLADDMLEPLLTGTGLAFQFQVGRS